MTVMHSLYREPGKVTHTPDKCTQCGLCVQICPADLLTLVDGTIEIQADSAFGCIACGHCMMVCPHDAISVSDRGIRPDDIEPLVPREQMATADQLAALMKARRSVRKFSDKRVEPALLERIVDMATMAPMGIPPWDIGCITVNGKENVHQLAEEVVKGYMGFLKIFKSWLLNIMRPFIGKAKYEMFADFIVPLAQSYVKSHQQGRDIIFYDAPSLLIFHHSPYTETTDATIACTYAMLAAESLGLGSTIIGGATPIIQRNKPLCQKLGVPKGNTPCIALILGYPATHFNKTIHRRFAAVNTIQ